MRRFIVLFFLICLPLSVGAADAENIYNKMSYGERFYLREFFKISICDNHFGYVLFHNKPMSASGFFLKCPSHELDHPYKNKLLKKGWCVWKKYENKIPHNGFVFCEEIDIFFDSVNKKEIKVCNIYLVNKKTLRSTLQAYVDCFKQRLGENFSPDEFLQLIETTKSILPHLHDDEFLLGILLGYGKDAPDLFYINEKTSLPKPLTKLTSTPSKYGKVQPITFVGDPTSKETQQTIQSYRGQAESIEQLCQNEDILKSVLKMLIDYKN